MAENRQTNSTGEQGSVNPVETIRAQLIGDITQELQEMNLFQLNLLLDTTRLLKRG